MKVREVDVDMSTEYSCAVDENSYFSTFTGK